MTIDESCSNCGALFDSDAGKALCPKPSPGEAFVDCGRGGHMFDVPVRKPRVHIPMRYSIAECPYCDADLKSPFPPRPEQRDPDGLGTFAAELSREFGIDSDEISTCDVARAWARTFGWLETPDGWLCPTHATAAKGAR